MTNTRVEQAIRRAVQRVAPGMHFDILTAITNAASEAVDGLVHIDPMTGAAHYNHEVGSLSLLPHEHMAVTTALQQLRRGEAVSENVAEQVVLAFARVAGVDDGDLPAPSAPPTGQDVLDAQLRRAVPLLDAAELARVDGRVDPYDLPMPVEDQ